MLKKYLLVTKQLHLKTQQKLNKKLVMNFIKKFKSGKRFFCRFYINFSLRYKTYAQNETKIIQVERSSYFCFSITI